MFFLRKKEILERNKISPHKKVKETKYQLRPDEVTKLQIYERRPSLIELIRLTVKGQLKKVPDMPCSLSQQRKWFMLI